MSRRAHNVSTLPDAAGILRALWKALDVQLPEGREESTRKYLRGQRALGEGVLPALIDALVAAGYFSSVEGERKREAWATLLTDGLSFAIANWDELVGHTRALSAQADFKTTATRYLRLAAIDFAIRAAAVDILLCIQPPPVGVDADAAITPTWAREDGVRRLVRALPGHLGTTRSELSPDKKFDDLFQGRHRPSIATLRAFADLVAKHDTSKTPTTTWHLHLLWTFALDDLCNEIAATLGREVVEDVARAFRRIRSSARRTLAGIQGQHGDNVLVLLADLVIQGARASQAGRLIDHIVRDVAEWEQAMHLVSDALRTGTIPEATAAAYSEIIRRAGWLNDLRASHAHWMFSELSQLVSMEPVSVDDIPADLFERFDRALLNVDANPQSFVDLCSEHPAAFRWGTRTLVQQAFVRGRFDSVLPMIDRFADVMRTPQIFFEAAVVHAAAGGLNETLRYIDAIGDVEPFASMTGPLRGVALLFAGRHADALQQLDALETRDGSIEYARGVALRGLGRIAEAFTIFEEIIARIPDHAPALEQAALCCYEKANTTRGRVQAKWSIAGNRYRKEAERLGRGVLRERRRSRR